MSGTSRISRRIAVGVAALGAAVALAFREFPLLRHRLHPTPYDDLLQSLPDRDSAAAFGAPLREITQAAPTARLLRAKMGSGGLKSLAERELRDGTLREVRGWVVPQSLALLCALAAATD